MSFNSILHRALLILITLVADIFTESVPVTYSVLEEQPSGTVVCDLIESLRLHDRFDARHMDKIRFSFLTKPDEGDLFVINESTGVIQTKQVIDRDSLCADKISCVMNYGVAYTTDVLYIVKVEIEITDINDNAPRFLRNRIVHRISEMSAPGASLSIPTPIDPDSGRNGIRSYAIVPQNYAEKFEVVRREAADGSVDVRLRLRSQLDYERLQRYAFSVVAFDEGVPPKSGSISVVVDVIDANDNYPEFDNETYRVTIPENLPVGTSIIRVTAHDGDVGSNGEIEYRFDDKTSQESGHLFNLNPLTGEISVRGLLDYENRTIHALSLSARDRGPDSVPDYAIVAVTIEDINDNAPAITLNSLTHDGIPRVAENSVVQTFVAHISVIDADAGRNGNFRCDIDNRQFNLTAMYATEFKLETNSVFDYEERSTYTVTLTCVDYGSPRMRSSQVIVVEIVDENDHAPRFHRRAYKHTIKENNEPGQYVMTVSASDEDSDGNGRIVFTLDQNVTDYLNIDPHNGVITAKNTIDHEDIPELNFNVTATDNGETKRSSQVAVTLIIIDEDDETPRFLNSSYYFTVEEELPVSHFIGNVTAEDLDSPPYDAFLYGIHPESGSARHAFEVDANTGQIFSAKVLDREQQAVYFLIVTVSPKDGNTAFTSTATVTIDVDDINDNSPIFASPGHSNESIELSSKAPQGYEFWQIRAYDLDSGLNGRLTYSISEGNSLGRFRLNQQNGALEVATDLSFIEYEDHKLVFVVHDGGTPSLSEEASLSIAIREDVPFVSKPSSFLSGESLTVILAFALATVVIALVIIVVIVVIVRNKQRRNVAKHYEKEKQLMIENNSRNSSRQEAMGFSKTPTPNSCVSAATEEVLSRSSSKQSTRQAATLMSDRGKPNGYIKMDIRHKPNSHQVISDDLPPPPTSWTEATVTSPVTSVPHLQSTSGSVRSNSSTASLLRHTGCDDVDSRTGTPGSGNSHDVHSPLLDRGRRKESPSQPNKPVVVFIRDQAETDIVGESDSAGSAHSNSDSGRGQSSEDGDTIHGRSATLPISRTHPKHTQHNNAGVKHPHHNESLRRHRPVNQRQPKGPVPAFTDSTQIDLLRELHQAMKSPQPERHLMMTQTLDRATKNKTNPNLHVRFAPNRANDMYVNSPYKDTQQPGEHLPNSQSAYDMHNNRASINSGDYFMYDSVDSAV